MSCCGIGRIILRSKSREEQERKTAGGLIVVETNREMKGTADNTWVGRVVDCGMYSDRQAVPHLEVKEFPLQPGSYVEHTCGLPFKTKDGLSVIRVDEVTRWSDANGPAPEWY